MRRVMAVVGVLVFMGVASAEEKFDPKKLDGSWVPESALLAGQAMPDEVIKSITLTLKGDKYTVELGGQTDAGEVKVDAKAKPAAMDITGKVGPNAGKTIKAIFELSGDTLKVCYTFEGTTRPTEFKSTQENKFFLVTYKRKKS